MRDPNRKEEINMAKKSLYVEGMTCQSCVMRTTRALLHLPGVTDVKVDLSEQKATFELNEDETTIESAIRAIQETGYGASAKRSFDWFYVWAVVILIGLLVLSKQILKYVPGLEQGASYTLIFSIGVLTSFHCVGMCGGITLSQVSSGKTFSKRTFSLFQYHLGRILSYTLVGTLLGAIGEIVTPGNALWGIVTLLGGIGMTLFALAGMMPRWFSKFHVPEIAATRQRAEGLLGGRSWVGIMNGFVPCGPLQGMQLFALASGSALKGGLSMLLFSLGTVPLLYGFGTFVTALSPKFRKRLIKLGFVFVLFLSIMMTMRGMSYLMGH
jgi:sulfite exporter TauE/SafE/copper chaperone CopZ